MDVSIIRLIKEVKKMIEINEQKEIDIYTEEGAEEFMNDDEISSEEHGFVIGYLQAM